MSAPEPSGLLFKHEDTQLLVALVVVCLAATASAWLLAGSTVAAFVALALVLVVLVGLLLHLRRSRQAENEQHLRHVQALMWLHDALPLRAPLPALTGWAASPELLATLVTLIREREPRRIVEMGSGSSTIAMSYALEQNGNGGRVLALDHIEKYARQSERQLARHGLHDRTAVQHAPLLDWHGDDGQSWQWYDLDALDDEGTVDLLVIDGPPRETQPMARYPAAPALMERLSDDAVIVLDDADRAGEQKILQAWLEAYPSLSLEMRPSPKGTAVLYRE
jgi:predicted O-methyltransferase YrrM